MPVGRTGLVPHCEPAEEGQQSQVFIDWSVLCCRGAGDPCMPSLLRTGWHTITLT